MKNRYSIFSLIRNAFSYHQEWPPAWRSPEPKNSYDAVIVGSPVHYSHYDARLADYLKHYREPLREIPSAFFSVSLGILSDEKSEKDEVRKVTDAYLAETGWNPPLRVYFGGALAYSKYNWVKRWLMKLVVRKGGGPTDTRYDYEFTDWDQVDKFVQSFVEFVKSCKLPHDECPQPSLYSKPRREYSTLNRRSSAV